MAKAGKNSGSSGAGASSSKTTIGDAIDSFAKAPLSREMVAAGLSAAAAALAASPTARRKIRDAGLDAADSASIAATTMMLSASRLGTLIAEAVAEAAQSILSGKWASDMTAAASSAANQATSVTSEAVRTFEADVVEEAAPGKRKPAKRTLVKRGRPAKRSALTKTGAPRAKPGPKPRATAASSTSAGAAATAKLSSPPEHSARGRRRAAPKTAMSGAKTLTT